MFPSAGAGAGLRSSWESGHLTDTNRMDWECPELSESVGEHADGRRPAGNVTFF